MALQKKPTRSGPVVDRSGAIPADDLSDFITQPPAKSGGKKTAAPAAVDKQPAKQATPMEPVISRLLAGENKSKFLLLADWFEAAVSDRGKDVYVMTSVGDVKFSVIEWLATPGFLKLIVNSEKMPFDPTPLTPMRLRKDGNVFEATCVSPLSPMFGGLPFAELLLIIEETTTTTEMDKNARVEAGKTPSVVSGKPSTDVDNEEPVAEGEKAASVRGVLPPKNFDVSREAQEA